MWQQPITNQGISCYRLLYITWIYISSTIHPQVPLGQVARAGVQQVRFASLKVFALAKKLRQSQLHHQVIQIIQGMEGRTNWNSLQSGSEGTSETAVSHFRDALSHRAWSQPGVLGGCPRPGRKFMYQIQPSKEQRSVWNMERSQRKASFWTNLWPPYIQRDKRV